MLLLQGAADPSPKFDPMYHTKFDMPSWVVPFSDRKQHKVCLIFSGTTALMMNLNTIAKLSQDPVPAVRYQIALGFLLLQASC